MLPILILGGAAAAALFLSGCEEGSERQRPSSHPNIHPASGSPGPEARFAQGVKPLVTQTSENGRMSSSAVLFSPGGAPAVSAALLEQGKKDVVTQGASPSNSYSSASPVSSIGDFYRQREYQKAIQGSAQEDPASEFSLVLGAKMLAEPAPPSGGDSLPAQPRRISTASIFQPRFD
jgi:hypothetical protein